MPNGERLICIETPVKNDDIREVPKTEEVHYQAA